MSDKFSYKQAFSRNLGWVMESEQEQLRRARVGIAGLGGVGGNYLLTLCRLGVENFHIADFDVFELQNFNRQVGATVPNIGRSKVESLVQMAKDINPNVQVSVFDQGINHDNVSDFVSSLDVYVDGLDFYCLNIRELVFRELYKNGVHGITVAPLGMGASLVNFSPGKMNFDDYFGIHSVDSDFEKALMFFLGLAPSGVHRKALVGSSTVDIKSKKAASTFMGCQLCAGVAVTEVLKVVLNRGPVISAPWSLHFDAFSYAYKKVRRTGGYKNPLQRLKYLIAKRSLNL